MLLGVQETLHATARPGPLLMLAQSANPSFFLADCVLQFTVEPNKLALMVFSEHSKLSRRKLSQFFKAIGNFIF
jgi:hypothetical protein